MICQARHCEEEAWVPGPGWPPPESYPFQLCVAHWNTDRHHPIVVETVEVGIRILHIYPNPPERPWQLANE